MHTRCAHASLHTPRRAQTSPNDNFWNTGVTLTTDNFKLDWTGTKSGTPWGSRSMLSYHNGMKFTTNDNDNDQASTTNCATGNHGNGGGFWYNDCYQNSFVHPDGNIKSWTDNAGTNLNSRAIYLRAPEP